MSVKSNLNLIIDVSVTGWIITDQNSCQMWRTMTFILPLNDMLLELLSDFLGNRQSTDYFRHFLNTVAFTVDETQNTFNTASKNSYFHALF